MPYGEQAKHRDMQAMLEKLPSEFRIIPTDSIINSQCPNKCQRLKLFNFLINGYDTNEAIANQLDVKTVTVKSVLYKTCQQVKI